MAAPLSGRAGTCIYYLLTEKDVSAWHKVKKDEIWGKRPLAYAVKNGARLAEFLRRGREFPRGGNEREELKGAMRIR